MIYLFFWIMMGVIVAIVAGSKGRSALAWFVYGAIIWPVALVHILVTPRAEPMLPRTPIESDAAAAFLADDRDCPHCAERIKKAAKICRFCQRDVAPA